MSNGNLLVVQYHDSNIFDGNGFDDSESIWNTKIRHISRCVRFMDYQLPEFVREICRIPEV